MIPKAVIRGLITAASAFTSKEAVVSMFELENPALLVTLPLSIIKHSIIPSNVSEFSCPHRQKLHKKCADATKFDKMTVYPVNIALEEMKIPLTRDAYKAIKKDLLHSQEMSEEDPLHKKVTDYKQQALNQKLISLTLDQSGEREGALMHSLLATGFDLKAKVASATHTVTTVMKRE